MLKCIQISFECKANTHTHKRARCGVHVLAPCKSSSNRASFHFVYKTIFTLPAVPTVMQDVMQDSTSTDSRFNGPLSDLTFVLGRLT